MLKELKFVHGAVARKDYVPALNHFRIGAGRIEGFNGTIALSSPIDLAITAMPKATSFVKAIERLPEGQEVAMNLTKAGKLTVKAGNFKVHVECWPDGDACPRVAPAGETYALPGGMLPVLSKLSPIMGIDASRPWACGILFRGQSAFATNNIIVLEHWLPVVFPSPINLPAQAIAEMLRIGEEPVSMQPEHNAITFHYASGAWLRTSLLATDWPDLSRVLDQECAPLPVHSGLFEAVKRLDAFIEKAGRLYFRGDVVATSPNEGEGALAELPGLNVEGCYHLAQMARLEGLATTIDLSRYPAPALFFGDMVRGAIVGMRAA
jgi:hypothetical protein